MTKVGLYASGAPPYFVLSTAKGGRRRRGREDDPGAPGAWRVHLREHALSVATRHDAPAPQISFWCYGRLQGDPHG